ncbi:Acid protease [Mycena indigotica]|uniref:Acid protease n=1 Tax=Mycena indigotica TaxID=2126181 RepID=A0A8H6WF32_9AGAR|nr:Acid protease [Mycena indigotica]KAF7312468.1 Acid protease [Mycena indigotica]
MFNKAALLLAVSLAVSAIAGPTVASAPPAPHAGLAIPLGRRAALTKADGVFDLDKAIAHNVFVANKHRNNLIALQKNKGVAAFNAGAEIKELRKIPVDVEARLRQSVAKRQAEPLTNIQNDLEWAGTVSIGTPAQKFLIDFDSNVCKSKKRYAASSSSTSSKKSGSFSIQYGDGSTVSGPIHSDTVDVAGVVAVKQHFSPVTTLSHSFSDDPIDGIMGMAFPEISNIGESPFFDTAHSAGNVDSNMFSFYLASTGSELYLGGTNSKLYSGDIEYVPVAASSGFWQATGAKIKVGSTTVLQDFQAIIDSGTTIMYGPPASVKEVFSHVEGSQLFDSASGFYSYPCDNPPKLSFNYGGKDWTISADNINLGKTKEGSSSCIASLSAQNLGLGEGVWLLGDSFMKNTYTVFNVDKKAVGFASLA